MTIIWKTEEIGNPVKDRLDELCEGGWSYNRFPQGEIKDCYKVTDIYKVFHLGTYAGAKTAVFGQARIKELPYKVRETLGLQQANPNGVWTCHYFLKVEGGQQQTGKTNIVAVFPNNYTKEDYVTVVEIGCEHDYQGKAVGRCAYDYTCKKCGFSYFIDSGD
jgi:hypothetical protein